jgi:hypothetical protein
MSARSLWWVNIKIEIVDERGNWAIGGRARDWLGSDEMSPLYENRCLTVDVAEWAR